MFTLTTKLHQSKEQWHLAAVRSCATVGSDSNLEINFDYPMSGSLYKGFS